MASSRPVILEGGCNFRDLGGYETADGRRLRHGILYRSGVLAYFTSRDLEALAALNVRVICDLRRQDERFNEPTNWPRNGKVEMRHWDDKYDPVSAGKLLGKRNLIEARTAMLDLYRAMPKWLHSRLCGFFSCILAGKVPMVFHCSAGKDRTGLAAALLLTALGVPREVVLKDYTLTNEVVDLGDFLQKRRKSALGLGNMDHPLLSLPKEALEPLLKADADYLMAALDQIESEYGTINHYLSERLGVCHDQRMKLQNMLLLG